MTTFHKIVKYSAIILAILLIAVIAGSIVSIIGFFASDNVLDEPKTYSVSQNIKSLKVEINAADFTIQNGDNISIVSNLKYLTVREKNGVLTIEETRKFKNYKNAVLTLYLPDDLVFENADISTGTGRLTVDIINAKKLSLSLGAGEVNIKQLNISDEAEIEGGAGSITILDGTIFNLDFDIGVGESNLTASLLGNSELNCGIGKVNIFLKGSSDIYRIEITKGVGNISLDGEKTNNGNYGNGNNQIEIEGGIGAISISFLP